MSTSCNTVRVRKCYAIHLISHSTEYYAPYVNFEVEKGIFTVSYIYSKSYIYSWKKYSILTPTQVRATQYPTCSMFSVVRTPKMMGTPVSDAPLSRPLPAPPATDS